MPNSASSLPSTSVWRRLWFWALLILCLGSGCAPKITKPPAQTFSVFVSGDLTFNDLSRMAQVVSQAQEKYPCLWLVNGKIFHSDTALALSDGEGVVALLGLAGVDGVLFEPGWLWFGVDRTKRLIDRARFRVLSANINDTFDLPIAHPWMTKRLGDVNLGITGLCLDSNALLFRLNGVRFLPPNYAGRKMATLLRGKANIIALLLPAGDSCHLPSFDILFISPEKGATRYDITCIGGQIHTVFKNPVPLAGVEPKPEVLKTTDSLKKALDSLSSLPVVQSRVKIAPGAFTKTIADGLLKLLGVDYLVYDSAQLVKEAIPPGTVTQERIIAVLSDPGRLVLMEITGKGLKPLFPKPGVAMAMAPHRKGRKLLVDKTYRVATTLSFLKNHPEIVPARFELSEQKLWEYTADILQAQGKR